jgi:hypothetical protein
MGKLEDYIAENNIDERMAYVLRDYKKGISRGISAAMASGLKVGDYIIKTC